MSTDVTAINLRAATLPRTLILEGVSGDVEGSNTATPRTEGVTARDSVAVVVTTQANYQVGVTRIWLIT